VSGVTNFNGAPSIDGVNVNFSPEDLAAALLMLQSKTQESQLTTAREGLNVSKKKLDEKNQQAMDKITDWIKKCEEASAKEKSAGIFGWLVKIFSFIAAAIAVAVAAVATVASGGAAAPLLALAMVGLVGAGMGLASQISQAAGGPPLELSSLMSKMFTAILEGLGVPKDKAEAAGKVMAGAFAVLAPGLLLVDPALAGNMLGGVLELSGVEASKAAIASAVMSAVVGIAISIVMVAVTAGANIGTVVDAIGKTMATASKIAQGTLALAAGIGTVAQGGLNIAKGADERDAANIQADKKVIDALIAKLQKQMEDDREEIKKVLQEIMDGMNLVSQMINDAGQSRSQLAANLGGRPQTI
jgi:hypothetical protein